MGYDARQIANWFVARSKRDGKRLSIMSLLKLTYIAHGWHLETQNAPLFLNRIEAWQYGPVIPDVYRAFRNQGINVTHPIPVSEAPIEPSDEKFLDEIYTKYGKLDAFTLSDLTHIQGGPWDIATKTGGYYAPIPDELIKQHYIHKRSEFNNKAANA
ncbi:Panacea domain-containing protein [Nitratireductor kimnyeongensis]|uniref:Panacea domain-containing protein n=1 Tax=Nitratireductor kimnyeongensis TaxID=430679 RepID=A0ABW0TBJ5_9HYPH|nr:type II toxin-antitoxin system antitoxin SocA domain-containing protein [Nitratireductor kimnyeongensis]QZZ36812.1 DUF4065 domain-containing protein [Nitratireductor kimnyeongensis]